MKRFFLPKALLFKEWKEHRWWVLAGLLLPLLFLYPSMANFLGGQAADLNSKAAMLWKVLMPLVYGVMVVPSSSSQSYPAAFVVTGSPYVSILMGIVAMGLIIALITAERNRGGMWMTFSGPVRRSDALRVKIVLAVGIVLASWLIRGAVVMACDIWGGMPFSAWTILHWLGNNLLFDLVLMAIGLVCAVVIMGGLPAGIIAIVLSSLPYALGVAIQPHTTTSGVAVQVHAFDGVKTIQPMTIADQISHVLRGLSPLAYGSPNYSFGTSSWPGTLYLTPPTRPMGPLVVLWFALWIVILGWIAYRAFLRMPLENSAHLILFPRLLPWFQWFLTGFISFIITSTWFASHRTLAQPPGTMLLGWLVLWVPLGIVAQYGWRWRSRRERAT